MIFTRCVAVGMEACLGRDALWCEAVRMMRRHKLFAAVTVAAVVVCGVVAVCLVRTLQASTARSFVIKCVERVEDPREYRLRPGCRSAGVTIDRLGFRVDPLAPPIETGDEVVVMLGDSVPFGAGVGDSDSPAAVLDARLRPIGLRCLNAGVPSYTIAQAAEHYERQVRGYYRVRAIVLHAANDVSLAHHYGANWTPTLTWAGGRFSGHAIEYAPLSRERPHPMFEHVASTLRAFIAARQVEGVPVYLMPITLRDGWRDAYYPLAQAVNGVIADAAEGRVIDFAHSPSDFVDQIHLSRAGAEKLADQVVAKLSKDARHGTPANR